MPETDLPPRAAPSGARFLAAQASPEFQELRSKLRRFVFPMTAFFLLWYALYVLLGAFAHDFMAIKVIGNINVGQTFAFDPSRFVFSNKTMVGVSLYDPAVLSRALTFLERHQHHLPLHRLAAACYPLADINDAFSAADGKRDVRASIVPHPTEG